MTLRSLLVVFWSVFGMAGVSQAQEPQYSFRQSFSVFTEYSNTSSRIILGAAQNRRFAALGLVYSRRLLHARHVDWYYAPEIIPLAFIQDPIATDTLAFTNSSVFTASGPIVTPCRAGSLTVPPNPSMGPPDFTFSRACSTRWTYAGGISPLGQRLNFRPRRRLQPFVAMNAGFLVSPHDVPVDLSSRFNFTFEFGGGIEFFRTQRNSWSVEYKVHHLSNNYIGATNPGVDNQIFRLSYSLAR